MKKFDKSQTKITDYFLKIIKIVIEDHPDIQNILLSVTNVENRSEFSNISSFLDCLRNAAIISNTRNTETNLPLKLFSLYNFYIIFIVGGRMLYELLHANLQCITIDYNN